MHVQFYRRTEGTKTNAKVVISEYAYFKIQDFVVVYFLNQVPAFKYLIFWIKDEKYVQTLS